MIRQWKRQDEVAASIGARVQGDGAAVKSGEPDHVLHGLKIEDATAHSDGG
jgi:hypothetical protein